MAGILPPGSQLVQKAPAKAAAPNIVTNQQQIANYNKYIKAHGSLPQSPKEAAANHISDMQQFLKNRGYNIKVDGVRGPETNAVIAAFHNKVAPGVFNSKGKVVKTSPSNRPAPPGIPDAPNAPALAKPAPAPRAATSPAQAPAPSPSGIDPYGYATSAANSEYDPQIAAVQSQLNLLSPQHAQNNADLTSWYKQLADMVAGQQTQQATDNTAQLKQYDQAANNAVGQLFGGGGANPAAGAAMAFHDIGHTSLEGQNDAQAAFLKNMAPILGAQGVDALRAEQGSYNKNNSLLSQQVGSLKAAKGQAYTKYLNEGQTLKTNQDTAQQSLELARQMMPSQIALAKAQATSAQSTADNAGAVAAANLKLINANVLKAQAAAKAAGGTWNLQNPQDRGSLAQAVRMSIGNKQGMLRVSPQVALQNIKQALAQAGLGSDADAQAIADSVFTEVLNNSHSAKLWKHVTYAGGKLVVAKAKAKK